MKNFTTSRTLSGLPGKLLWLLPAMIFCQLSLSAQSTTFIVTVEPSTDSNPNGNNAGPEVFYIDGVESPELTLTRGTTYTFVMDNAPVIHPFYISTSATGGGASAPYNDGVTGQFATGTSTLTFTPGASTPNLLYYQCAAHQYMGWKINVVGGGAAEDTTRFRALLAGDNEVPAIASSGFGEVTATLIGDELTVEGEFSGLNSAASASHLHLGFAGQSGPVSIPLVLSLDGGSLSGSLEAGENSYTLTAEQKAALMGRRMYLNIHSTTYPAGEIRGQLLPARAEVFTAALTGRAEIPANRSTATGGVVVERYGDTIILSGSFSGLESPLAVAVGGGAHIHMAALDSNGPVIHPLRVTSTGTGMTAGVFHADSNTFVLTGGEIEEFLQLGTYVNVHSTTRTGGEIRGQIIPHDAVAFEAWLAGLNEVPAMAGLSQGGAIGILHNGQLMLAGNFIGLESDLAVNIAGGAHIHRNGVGMNGPIIHALTSTMVDPRNGSFRVDDNTFRLGSTAEDSLRQGLLYVNVHSETRQGGEIRGQLLPAVNMAPSATAVISPAPGATIPIPSDTSQQLTARWNAATDANLNGLSYTWQVAADADFNVILFTTPPTTDTAFSVSFGDVLALLEEAGIDPSVIGPITVHHRVIASDGSLWQMSPVRQLTLGEGTAADADFRAVLAGRNEVPAIETHGVGMVTARLDGDTLRVSGIFNDLGSAVNTAIRGGAHIHIASAGTSGPIAFDLDLTLDANQRGGSLTEGDNTFVLNSEQMAALMERRMYVNVHTMAHGSGEIRGQLLPASSTVYRTSLSGRAEIPPNVSGGMGGVILEIQGDDTLRLSGGFSGLQSSLATGVAAHIHTGALDTNGPVTVPLLITPGTEFDGTFSALANLAPPGIVDLGLLTSGEFYVNVHTVERPAGELRGQLVPEDSEILEAWLASYNGVPSPGSPHPQSDATGSVVVVLDSNRLSLAGSFGGLSAPFTAAHIHMAAPGQNGGVEIPLNVTLTGGGELSGRFDVESNTYTLTPAQIDALLDGMMYVNVHSQNYPAGEIRGQLLVSTNVYPAMVPLLGPVQDQVVTLDENLTGALDVLARRSNDPNGNQVVYALELSSTANFEEGFTVPYLMTDSAGSISFMALAAFADSAGIEIDEDGEILFARIVASDGSLRHVGGTTEFSVRAEVSSVSADASTGRLLALEGVSPNPVETEGILRIVLGAPASVSVDIYDAGGRLLLRTPEELRSGGTHALPLAVKSLQSGTYLFRVTARVGDRSEVRTGEFVILQ